MTIASGDLKIDGATVGEISNEFPNVSSFTKNGLTINLLGVSSSTSGDTNKITAKTLNELTADQKTIVAGLFKWWAKECLKLNEESYGIGFNSSSTMVKEIGLYFYDSKGSGNTLATVWNWNSGSKTTRLMLNVNMNYYSGIAANNFDGEWQMLATVDTGHFAQLQDEFAHEKFFVTATEIFAKENFSLANHSLALQAVVFARAVQFGAFGCAELFKRACPYPNLSYVDDMSCDRQLITAVFDYLIANPDFGFSAKERTLYVDSEVTS